MNAIMSTTNEKTEHVLELMESLDNAIIFTWTAVDVSLLTALIAKTGKPVYSITGATAKADRVAIINRAASEKATIVATIDSCGVGVDGLQHVSSHVIFHSLSHSPKLHLQAESRAFRMGQVNPVVITYIVMQDSADELVISILDAKSSQDGASATESDKSAFSSLKMDDASMQAVLDDWVKNATDEIDTGTANSDGWDDREDEE
jgi:superfamily II DNA or RNA helicase